MKGFFIVLGLLALMNSGSEAISKSNTPDVTGKSNSADVSAKPANQSVPNLSEACKRVLNPALQSLNNMSLQDLDDKANRLKLTKQLKDTGTLEEFKSNCITADPSYCGSQCCNDTYNCFNPGYDCIWNCWCCWI